MAKLRVLLEIGKKGRRVVAGVTDWPGLDRWGADEDAALAKVADYLPRYAGVAERAGMGEAFARQTTLEVVERYEGSSSTDFWGIAHVPSGTEQEPMTAKELERRLALLQACWAYFDDVAARVSDELARGPHSGGRDREGIVHHVYGSERMNFSPKVEVRTGPGILTTRDGLRAHREAFLDAIRTYHAEERQARTWPIAFLIRRTAHHLLDHAWELEDRGLGR